jgi:hypothetical protein
MSLVDIPSPAAEDQIMDPVFKQYVDSSLAVAEARNDAKLAEFRATIEAYTARADEREAAVRDREAAAREREAAARELELVRMKAFERRIEEFESTVKSVKRAIYTATLSAAIAIAALNAALYQGILSMFDVGRQFGAIQVEMQRQLREMDVILKQKR